MQNTKRINVLFIYLGIQSPSAQTVHYDISNGKLLLAEIFVRLGCCCASHSVSLSLLSWMHLIVFTMFQRLFLKTLCVLTDHSCTYGTVWRTRTCMVLFCCLHAHTSTDLHWNHANCRPSLSQYHRTFIAQFSHRKGEVCAREMQGA